MSESMTYMIQQSASRIGKAINKPLKSRISSPARAWMTTRREMVGTAIINKEKGTQKCARS